MNKLNKFLFSSKSPTKINYKNIYIYVYIIFLVKSPRKLVQLMRGVGLVLPCDWSIRLWVNYLIQNSYGCPDTSACLETISNNNNYPPRLWIFKLIGKDKIKLNKRNKQWAHLILILIFYIIWSSIYDHLRTKKNLF